MKRRNGIWVVLAALVLFSLVLAGCKLRKDEGKPVRTGVVAVSPGAAVMLNDVDLPTAVGATLVADQFGWRPSLVTVVMRDAHLSLEDAVVLFALLELAKSQDVDFAITLRQQGLGWGVIAHRLGIHPGVFNQLRVRLLGAGGGKPGGLWVSDLDFRNGLFIIFLSDHFAIAAPVLWQRFEVGIVMPDLMLALFLGRRSGRGWDELLKERGEKRQTWLAMYKGKGVDLSDLDRIAGEVKQPPSKERTWKGEGKEERQGQGQAKGQEQGQGKAQGMGKEQGQGQGSAEGQAKGQGREEGQAKGQGMEQGQGKEQGQSKGEGRGSRK